MEETARWYTMVFALKRGMRIEARGTWALGVTSCHVMDTVRISIETGSGVPCHAIDPRIKIIANILIN
jgi:hypothetical protein